MRILVIGSGGREHALVWKLAQSKHIERIFCAPGNGGISEIAQCVDIKADDLEGLLNFARKEKIDLTVTGSEIPLAKGIVDLFQKNDLRIFGPTKKAAQLEASKVFSKEMMKKFGVPTADFKVFDDAASAKKSVHKLPVVIKADGLAAGKGVVIAKTKVEAHQAIDEIMVEKIFGESGNKIIIEDCLEGEEASILVISDGKNYLPLASSQDHKRVYDNDEGPNTGGMGAYSPAPVVDILMQKKIEDEVIKPIIDGMRKEGIPYKGILYAGIMVTKDGPKVLEFNVRFGDPETQAILPRLNSDLAQMCLASIEERLSNMTLEWKPDACVCVVVASGGYPGKYEKDKEIFGLDKLINQEGVVVFHAGTKKAMDKIMTSGGRVLGATALGKNIKEAIAHCYEAILKINFESMHYRRDIGKRALERIK